MQREEIGRSAEQAALGEFFVQGDIDQFMKNVKAFEAKYGVSVRVDNEGWEDVRPKAAVAANTGAGPDIILSTNDDANLYPEKLVDFAYRAAHLGSIVRFSGGVCDSECLHIRFPASTIQQWQ